MATLFTGRYIEIHVFPFSFQEYCQYYDDISDKDKLFDEYTIKGGLAGSYAYRTEKDRTNYIKEVYETIVTRDLVQKYNLRDTTSEVRNTLKALKSSICVTAVFDMQYWETEIWIMAEYMKTSYASRCLSENDYCQNQTSQI